MNERQYQDGLTVAELIKELQGRAPQDPVEVYTRDSRTWYKTTGVFHGDCGVCLCWDKADIQGSLGPAMGLGDEAIGNLVLASELRSGSIININDDRFVVTEVREDMSRVVEFRVEACE